jgi:hypothetical protein
MVILHNFFNPTHYEYFLNKYKDLPVTMFMDHVPNLEQLSLNRTKVYLLHEPNELFGVHNWVEQNYYLFDTVLTYNKHLLEKLPNAVEFSFGLVHTDDKNYYNKFITPKKNLKYHFYVVLLIGLKVINSDKEFINLKKKLKFLTNGNMF